MDILQSAKLENKNFPQPILLILPCRVHYSLHGGVNVWLGPFSALSDRILFRVLWDRVLFRVLSDRVSYRALIDRVPFRVVSNRFLYRVFIDWVLFRVFLSVLIDSILFRVLSPRFLVCRVHQLHRKHEGFCNEMFCSFLREFNVITRNLGKFLKREKRLHPRFLTGFWIHLCRVIYIQRYSSRGILKGFSKFLEKFP